MSNQLIGDWLLLIINQLSMTNWRPKFCGLLISQWCLWLVIDYLLVSHFILPWTTVTSFSPFLYQYFFKKDWSLKWKCFVINDVFVLVNPCSTVESYWKACDEIRSKSNNCNMKGSHIKHFDLSTSHWLLIISNNQCLINWLPINCSLMPLIMSGLDRESLHFQNLAWMNETLLSNLSSLL